MYKPGTQLIMTELWAAAAAHKLGFEVTHRKYLGVTMEGTQYSEPVFAFPAGQQRTDTKDIFQITVTESGPNAAEWFLPQVDDYVEWAHCHPQIVCADDLHPKSEALIPLSFARMYAPQKGVRILERNGIPFPQFSEVIEP